MLLEFTLVFCFVLFCFVFFHVVSELATGLPIGIFKHLLTRVQ